MGWRVERKDLLRELWSLFGVEALGVVLILVGLGAAFPPIYWHETPWSWESFWRDNTRFIIMAGVALPVGFLIWQWAYRASVGVRARLKRLESARRDPPGLTNK